MEINYNIFIARKESFGSANSFTKSKAYYHANINELSLSAEGETPVEALENVLEMYEDYMNSNNPKPLPHNAYPNTYTEPDIDIEEEMPQ